MTTATKLVNLLDVLTADRPMPDGCDRWAIHAVHPDLTSSDGFQWSRPGQWTEAPGPVLDRGGLRPDPIGDGIGAAYTWRGMASSAIPARTLLLVAHSTADVFAADSHQVRLRRAYVVDVVDGERLVRDHGKGADLRRADLFGAELAGAKLSGANLRNADLFGADLAGADLNGAGLRRADLRRADLRRADLFGADLRGADLGGAVYNPLTVWPDGFDPDTADTFLVN